jgi:hypothetical protein
MRAPGLYGCAALLIGAITGQAATFTVSNTSNAGAGTLRQAIVDANTAASDDTILFNLPRPSQISVTSALPSLTGNLRIINDARDYGDLITVARTGAAQYRIFTITPGSTVEIAGLLIFGGNAGVGSGGGILNDQASLTLRQCVMVGNTASTGGAIYNPASASAQLTVTDCAFVNNSGSFLGGAIVHDADRVMMLQRCEFSNNTGEGAGVVARGPGTIVNCTFSNNTANPGRSGGLAVAGPYAVTVRNCTFAENAATDGGGSGGIYLEAGAQLNIGNTVLKRGSNGANFAVGTSGGFITSAGHNISDDAANGDSSTGPGGSLSAAGDRRNTDPQLGPLPSFGNSTRTRTPLPGSPAIDAGDDVVLGTPFFLTTDQRGIPRRIGAHVDVGAAEVDVGQGPFPEFEVNTTDEHNDGLCGIGDCTLWEAINAANASGGGGTVIFRSDVVGTITNRRQPGGLQINAPMDILGPGARLLSVSGENVSRIFKINPGAQSLIYDLTLSKGFAPGGSSGDSGGAIWNLSNGSQAVRCTLSSNAATLGGAIYNDGRGGEVDLTVFRCSLLSNSALRGGAIYNDASSAGSKATAFISDCTLADNAATATGGAIHNNGNFSGSTGFAEVDLRSATLSVNTAPPGGGSIYNEADFGMGPITIANTILNIGPSGTTLVNRSGTVTSFGGNLSRDAVGGDGTTAPGGFLNATGDMRNTDPLLGALANNGGQTDTLALLFGSPAINAGNSMIARSIDQRGYGRNGPPDIGAFEFRGLLPVTLANISTRLRVETGDNVLIAGFIVTGTESKKVIVRAIGPSLPFPGVLANPTLELYQGSTLLASNDDWQTQPTADRQAVIDSGIPPSNDLESALVRTLPAGGTAYTAIMRGVSNTSGIGLVEVYDLDRSVNSKLANISTRGLVQTGDNVLIAGTIIVGTQSQKVIVRAIGPSLPIAGRLENPTLELRNGSGTLLEENDNWSDSANRQAIIDSTIPPTNDLESAIVRTLSPGNYTAIVRGAGGSSGIGSVEAYALP